MKQNKSFIVIGILNNAMKDVFLLFPLFKWEGEKKKREREAGKAREGKQINVFRKERVSKCTHTHIWLANLLKLFFPLNYVGYKVIMTCKEVTEHNQSTLSSLLLRIIHPPQSQGDTLVVKWMHFPHLE